MFRNIIITGLLLSFLFLASCEETTEPETTATMKSLEQLSETYGYEWIVDYMNFYTPVSTIADSIDLAFDSTKHKFVIFFEPKCVCKELVREPAYLVKVLNEANIPDSCYKLYATPDVKSKHPYQKLFAFSRLPFVALITSGSKVYSVLDTFNVKRSEPGLKIEHIILQSLLAE